MGYHQCCVHIVRTQLVVFQTIGVAMALVVATLYGFLSWRMHIHLPLSAFAHDKITRTLSFPSEQKTTNRSDQQFRWLFYSHDLKIKIKRNVIRSSSFVVYGLLIFSIIVVRIGFGCHYYHKYMITITQSSTFVRHRFLIVCFQLYLLNLCWNSCSLCCCSAIDIYVRIKNVTIFKFMSTVNIVYCKNQNDPSAQVGMISHIQIKWATRWGQEKIEWEFGLTQIMPISTASMIHQRQPLIQFIVFVELNLLAHIIFYRQFRLL